MCKVSSFYVKCTSRRFYSGHARVSKRLHVRVSCVYRFHDGEESDACRLYEPAIRSVIEISNILLTARKFLDINIFSFFVCDNITYQFCNIQSNKFKLRIIWAQTGFAYLHLNI